MPDWNDASDRMIQKVSEPNFDRCCPGCLFCDQRNRYLARVQADNRYLRIGLMAVTAALALLIACVLLLPLGAPQMLKILSVLFGRRPNHDELVTAMVILEVIIRSDFALAFFAGVAFIALLLSEVIR